eukprot:gnl/TRDRNA2_/TRDRNA2_167463_c3_seq1.p1 gnl/TRDRNA2_/TRDRNA2_167463_c3~~gnl/TRDRNA2_/TRDRNA2_167463_c3_seq1.p1  ORF type:complete len:210 (+),score=4.89 gnl/TRDRNA2_/TRDRNA2_167463_c3_seq1:36-632(+)
MWHGDLKVVRRYIKESAGNLAVFDYPLFYVLKRCMAINDFGELAPWNSTEEQHHLAGLLGADPVRAVTFVENHDTAHLPEVEPPFGNATTIVSGYAFILTHPGTPSIFWPHIFDSKNPDHMAKSILSLCKLRREAGVHSKSQLDIFEAGRNVYAAQIHGKSHKIAVKLGSRDWHPGWEFPPDPAVSGHSFAVWISLHR